MMPNLDPRTMAMAMKRMGIKQTEIDAIEVIIKTREKNIIVREPSVSKISMAGQESFQVSGKISEEAISLETEISEEDAKTVAEHSNCSEEEAREALKETKGDIAAAILKMKGE